MDLKTAVKNQEEEMIACLQQVIRFPSERQDAKADAPFGEPVRDCLLYVLKQAEKLGMKTCNVDNYMGWAEIGEGPEMVAILGHLDVVPAGEGWDRDPYSGDVENGNIYGRGTMDDKGPAVAALYAMKAIMDSGLPLKRRIRILFGTNEETGSADMAYYREHGGEIPVSGFTPDGEYPLINGEKGIINAVFTAALNAAETAGDGVCGAGEVLLRSISGGTAFNIVPGHAKAELSCSEETARRAMETVRAAEKDLEKEIAEDEEMKVACASLTEGGKSILSAEYHAETGTLTVLAEGKEAHASLPWKGVNAIGALLFALNRLPVAGEAAEKIRFLAGGIGLKGTGDGFGIALEDEISGRLSFNTGMIEGNGGEIKVFINYRYPVTRSYEECAPKLIGEMKENGFELTSEAHKASLYVDKNEEYVQKLLAVYHEFTGLPAEPMCIGGGTYAKAIPNTVAFGPIFPGDTVREHLPNEFWELDKLKLNMQIIAEAVYRLAN